MAVYNYDVVVLWAPARRVEGAADECSQRHGRKSLVVKSGHGWRQLPHTWGPFPPRHCVIRSSRSFTSIPNKMSLDNGEAALVFLP